MNSSHNNMNHGVDPDLHEKLRRYYRNELSQAERNLLERRALEDPFLKDAMDGFDENPDSFAQFEAKFGSRLKQKRSYTLLVGALVLVGLFAVTTLLKTNVPTENQLVENVVSEDKDTTDDWETTVEDDREYEVLPPEIETLSFIPEVELISVQEVVDYQTKTEIDHQGNSDSFDTASVHIDDPIDIPEEFELQDENHHKYGQESVETTYMFDLRVVDYRKLQRDNEKISYKRYEFSGTPANIEDDSVSANSLIEREVEIPYHIYLSKSMSFFAKSNFKQALNRYLLILEQYPDDNNALFYGGLAYYNLGKYEKSLDFFNQILNSNIVVFREEALWYKAKSLLQQQKEDAAIEILEAVIAGGGFYTKDAIELRGQLLD